MAITGLDFLGPKADLTARISPKNDVILGFEQGKYSFKSVLKSDQFISEDGIKISERMMSKIKQYGMEDRLELLIANLKKILVK